MKKLSLILGITFVVILSFLILSKDVLAKGKSKINRNSPKIVWKKIFGGKKDYSAKSIAATRDGGFIVVGDIQGNAWVIKINKNGKKVWEKIFKGNGYATEIKPTKDGGFILVVSSQEDAWVIKINKNGKKIWKKNLGRWIESVDYAITPTRDGGFILVGEIYSEDNGFRDVWIIKIDKNGKKIWKRVYDILVDDFPSTIKPTKDGGFIIVGNTMTSTRANAWLLKIDKNGRKIWEEFFGAGEWTATSIEGITQTKDGGFILIGFTGFINNDEEESWIMKIDKNRNQVWKKTFRGKKNYYPRAIIQTRDGGFIVVGDVVSKNSRKTKAFIMKMKE